MRDSADHLLTVINDILDFSRLEADRLELDEGDFEIEPLVQSVCDAMAPHAFAKGLEIGFYVAPGRPTPSAAMPAASARCCTTWSATRSNSPRTAGSRSRSRRPAAAAAAAARQRRRCVRFDVADTGIGIPATVLPSLFEQFSQADARVARRYGGTGLGLSISRKLAGLMGGTIGVASEEGQGSQFWFTAALAPAGAAPGARRAAARPPAHPVTSPTTRSAARS